MVPEEMSFERVKGSETLVDRHRKVTIAHAEQAKIEYHGFEHQMTCRCIFRKYMCTPAFTWFKTGPNRQNCPQCCRFSFLLSHLQMLTVLLGETIQMQSHNV